MKESNSFIKDMLKTPMLTWKDKSYNHFIMSMLRVLEPRFEPSGTMIVNEGEEASELFFVHKG